MRKRIFVFLGEHIYNRHNKTLLLYPLVFPVKYRRKVLDGKVSEYIKEVCLRIGERYEIQFIEIGTDEDPVHLLMQSDPSRTFRNRAYGASMFNTRILISEL